VKFNNNNVLDRLLRVAVVKTATPAYAVAGKRRTGLDSQVMPME